MSIKREWTTPITAGAFLLLAVTGILMFFHSDTGLNKAAHEWVGWVFLAGGALHLAVNFTVFKKYLTQRKGQVLFGVFALLLVLSFVPGGGSHRPPFVPPLRALGKAPLTTLAQVAGASPEQLIAQLEKEGLAVQSAQQSLSELVGDDLHKQMRFMNLLLDK
jgi:peptidoglycan/LPS O-acetylase OafA/YrhL